MIEPDEIVAVFTEDGRGGNPVPVVLDAESLSDAQMQGLAERFGLETCFVLPATSDCDLRLRYWVPRHEMSMCGHATLGALWLLASRGSVKPGTVMVETLSGAVRALVHEDGSVEIGQSLREVTPVDSLELSDILGAPIGPGVLNASTSRVKTLVPVDSPAALDALRPDFGRIEGVCDRLGSTGIYAYAHGGPGVLHARQFPRASGYPEDPATGIAAAALALGLADQGRIPLSPLVVRQGQAMGSPSRLHIRFGQPGECWLSGDVSLR